MGPNFTPFLPQVSFSEILEFLIQLIFLCYFNGMFSNINPVVHAHYFA